MVPSEITLIHRKSIENRDPQAVFSLPSPSKSRSMRGPWQRLVFLYAYSLRRVVRKAAASCSPLRRSPRARRARRLQHRRLRQAERASVIPAGTLLAGSSCDATPRITNEELPGTSVQLGEFNIDTYPYPNDPAKAPVTNVSRDEAAQMCASAGKRLCTELEWERACKGGSNQEYEYGKTFTAASCATVAAGAAPGAGSMGSRAQCASSFGVHDMHGLVFEWTDSNWGRGTSGGLVTTRGGYGPNGELASRCANGQGRAPLEKAAVVGFRCCSGAKNTADVNITNTKQPALVEEPSVDAALNTRLIAALPKEQRTRAERHRLVREDLPMAPASQRRDLAGEMGRQAHGCRHAVVSSDGVQDLR